MASRLTLGHVRHLVLAHCLEGLVLKLSLGLRRDAEEVQVCTGQGYEAGEDSEDANSHGGELCIICLRMDAVISMQKMNSQDGERIRVLVCSGRAGYVGLVGFKGGMT